jgi:hypothetical protein
MDKLNLFLQRHRLQDEFGALIRRQGLVHPWASGLFRAAWELRVTTLHCSNGDHCRRNDFSNLLSREHCGFLSSICAFHAYYQAIVKRTLYAN